MIGFCTLILRFQCVCVRILSSEYNNNGETAVKHNRITLKNTLSLR